MDGIDKLYQGLSAVYDLGTPEEFRKKIADEEHRKKLYEQVSPNIDLGVADYPAFSQKIDGYLQAQPAVQQVPLDDERSRAFGQMPDPLYSGQYQYHQQVADKEAQMQREEQAQLPITDHDRQLQEQIRQMEIEGKWGKPNGTTFGVDKQTGMPTITTTEGDGMHLYAGEQLANQDEIDALKGQLPSYLTREVKTPQDLLVNTAEAWSSNTRIGRDFKDMLEAGTITPEEYKQAMIDANQDYINQQTRILGQKATNATIADINQTINPIIEQLQAERREAMQRAAGQGQMRGGAYGAIGAQMSANTAYDSKKDAVLSEYLQAQQYLVDAIKISEAAQKGQGFWKGLGNSLGDVDTWDMGISQLVRSANLKKIVEKYEKKPDSLTDSERALMDAAVAYMSACAYNSDKLSRLYKAGQTTGESLPFMLQFAIMPIGAIKDKVAKGILGYGIEQFGGKALQTAGKYTFGRAAAETGVSLLGNMAAAGVQTAAFGAPKIAEGTISRMTGDIKPEFDENGRIVYGGRENQQGVGEALWNAGVDMYVENLSEMILTSGDPIKAFVRGTNLFKNLSKNEAIQVLTKMGEKWGESTIGQMAGRMQFRNYPEEVAEEYVGNLLRWGMSTDVHSAAEAGLDADSQIDLWMGLAPTSIAFAGLGLGEYSVRGGIDRFQSSQAARKLRNIMLEGEERKYLDNLLKSRDSDEFKFAAHDVVKSILRNDKLSAREKRAYLDNLYVTYQSQLALEAEDAKIADEVKTEVQGITNKNNGYVYPVSLAGDPNTQGHIVAGYVEVDLTDPSKPRIGNDEIVTVKLNDGRVVQLSTIELDLTGTPQMAQEVFNTRAEERINNQRLIDKSKSAFHEGEEGTIQVPNPQTGELDELPSKILSVTDEGVQVEITDFAGQSTTALIPHDEALRSLRVVKPQEVQHEQPQAQETPAEQTVVQQPEAAVGPTADNIVIFSNGTEEKRAIDNGDGTYTIMEKGENNEDIPFKQTEEWLNDRGYVRVEQEQPEDQTLNQGQGQNEGLTQIVPNIYTTSADDYVRATVENKYKGNKAKAQANIAAQLNGAKSELQAAQREFEKFKNKGITSKMNSDQWDEQYDKYEQQIKGLTALVSKLEAANIAVVHYKTQAELQEEAERKAREAAMREKRRQLGEAEAAGDIEAKWQNTKKTVGFTATKTLPNGQKVNGHYILTEAGDVVPSHDPRKNYADSEGYVMENGQNVNDNNYKDPDVQRIALDIAQNYGGQAVEQMPFLENRAGRVLSGNNRTISGIIAAENNTDQAYLAALAENAQQYGFTPEQLAEYQHPRLQFVVEDELPFTTATFAMFNQQEKKTKSSVNRAVANSKMITEAVRDRLLEIMDQYESLDSFFGSSVAASAVTQTLINEGLMTQQEVAEKMEDSGIFNQTGKEYVTDMLLGTLFDEKTIRMLAGEKALKQAILRALPSIVENRRLKGYELTESINAAVQILYEARRANEGKSTADAFLLFLRQVDAFHGKVTDRFDGFDIILANRMSAGVEQLREMLNLYNNSARDEANGQMGFFEPRTINDIKQDVYDYYTKQQPDLAAALNGGATQGAQSQSAVPSGAVNAGEVRQVISPEQLSELRQQAQEFSDKLGVPIVVFDNINDVPDTEKAAKEIYVKEGNNVDAWMSADGKTIYVNANSLEIQSEGGLRRKVFHEIVAHKGLRQLMGNQVFDQLCAYVWEAMPVDQRVKYYDYAQQNYPGRSENELRLIAADEYMAFNAEQFTSLDTNDQSEAAKEVRTIWQKIADKLRELLDKILGDSFMTDDFLAELYKISYNNLRQRAQTPKEEQPEPIGESTLTTQGKAPQTPMGSEKAAEIEKVIADFKKQYPDPNVAIFFRNGRTYDIYGEDAVKAAEILGVEPTEKDGMPFVSFPTEDVGTNLRKFIAKGVKVGIASHPAHKPSKGDYQQGDKFIYDGSEATIRTFNMQGEAVVNVGGRYEINLTREQLDDILDNQPEQSEENPRFSVKNNAKNLRNSEKSSNFARELSRVTYPLGKSSISIDDEWSKIAIESQRESMPATAPWSENIGDAMVHTNLPAIKGKYAELHAKAKAGDVAAASELVKAVVKRERVKELAERYPNAIVAFPHAEEASGWNKIPALYADEFAAVGLDIVDMVQANRPHHTGSDKVGRFVRRARYDGEVEAGREYILVDDHITMGGTLRDLKDYIESKGGKVVAVSALSASAGGTKLTPTDEQIKAIEEAGITNEQLKNLGIADNVYGITKSEAREILVLANGGGKSGSSQGRSGRNGLGKSTSQVAGDNDPRFSVGGTQVVPIDGKSLVGLHNISAEKLRKALKMGGLANPSAAVIDIARQNHHDYGEVSLVLSSNMVENADGTYAGDAWTPMFPQVEYRQGKQTEKRIKALVKGLPDNLASAIALRIRDYMDGNSRNSGMEYLYLKEQGRELPIEHTPRRYPYISIKQIADRLGIAEPEYWSSDVYQAYEQLPEDQLFDFNLWLEQNGNQEEIDKRKAMVERWRSEGKDAFANTWVGRQSQRMSFAAFDSAGYRILRDERDAGEENTGMTLDKASYIVDTEGLRPEFETWLQQKIDGLGYEEVLFGGYTPSGNRRWLPNTVENASKLMNQKSQTNYLERESVNETKAMLMEKFRTLAQIRKHRDILEPDREKIKAAYEAVSSDWNQLGMDFRDYTQTDKRAYQLDDNPFIAIDTALARIQEAMFKADPIAFLNREYRYSLPADSEFGTRIKEIKERIKNLPSRYFETKFRRPVYLDEFRNAVVPNDLPQDLRAGLESAGLRLFSYDPNAQGSRRDATLEATAGEGIRFSINGRSASTGSSKRSNRDVEALRQFESVRPEIAKEMESIKNNALNDGTFMQAPNGKPSRLNERQWLQVRTRAFKRWFGDWENDPQNASKVLDDNGEPLVVFHATPYEFNVFNPAYAGRNTGAAWLGRGMYFSDHKSTYYGKNIMPVFLNIRNAADIYEDNWDKFFNDHLQDFRVGWKGFTYKDYLEDTKGKYDYLELLDKYGLSQYLPVKNPIPRDVASQLRPIFERDGYDGVIAESALFGKDYVAFTPNQIKSATDNNGDFSEENDDIRFSISGNTRTLYAEEMESIKNEAVNNGTFMQAPNGKPSRLNERQWLQVRTRAFKRWFGDWELAAKEVKISDATDLHFANNAAFLQYAKEHFQEDDKWKSYVNKDTGNEIHLSSTGINKSMSNAAVEQSAVDRSDHLRALGKLDEILENSILGETHADRDNDPNILEVQRYYGAITIDDKVYRVKTTVKKVRVKKGATSNQQYAFEVQEMELIEERPARQEIGGTQGANNPTSSNNSISAAKLLKNVETSKQKGKKLLDFSQIVDENGEPRVFYSGTTADETTRVWDEKTKTYLTEHVPFTIFKRKVDGYRSSGFWFNSNLDNAGGYGDNVYECFLNLRNPLVIDAQGNRYASIPFNDTRMGTDEIAAYAESNGYDGVIFENIYDGVDIGALQNMTTDVVAFSPNQIKSATDNDGSFSEENDDIRFSISNQNNDIFYSNAERAVEGIKQEKATPEQWRAMIEKAGGLKAGEDKWIGLSDWLAQQRPKVELQPNETRSQFVERAAAENKRFTLSKQDLLDYIREHKIQIEEVEYADELSAAAQERLEALNAEFQDLMAQADAMENSSLYLSDDAEWAYNEMKNSYGDDFEMAFEWQEEDGEYKLVPKEDWYNGGISDAALYYLGDGSKPINETRKDYTTEGLENKREIALTVPTIESWNESDEIHFGDAGEGRAIAWVRFGDATDEQGNKTLVIDEIQSKRHQEGREKGYVDSEKAKKYDQLRKDFHEADKEYHDYRAALWNKYKDTYATRGEMLSELPEDENARLTELRERYERLSEEWGELRDNSPANAIPAAPFEKNWHELAMKRILRFAAENGYDKVAWTTGDQQAARYDLGKQLDELYVYYNDETGLYDVSILPKGGDVDSDVETLERGLDDEGLKRTIGKDLYNRVMEEGKQSGWDLPVTLTGDDLVIGTDGMRGFYDDMLPRFMQKYGKKWGVQVGEVTMPQLEEGYQTMHAIDINDAMRESVMEGQPMFSISGRGVNGTMKPQEGETRSQYIARVAETVKNMTPRNTTIDDAIRFSITVNHNSPYLLKRADGAFVDPETGERLGFDHRFMGRGEGNQAHGWGSYFSVDDIRSYAESYKERYPSTYHGGNADYWVNKALNLEEDAYFDNFEDEEINESARVAKLVATILRGLDRGKSYLDSANELINYYAGKTREEFQKTFESLNESDFRVAPEIPKHHYTVEIPDNDGTNYLEEERYYTVSETEEIAKRISLAEGRQWGAGDLEGRNSDNVKFATGEDIYRIVVRHLRKTEWDRLSRSEILTNNPAEEASKLLNKAGFVGIHYFGFRDGECYVIFDENDAKITNHIRFSVTGGANEQQPIGVSYQNPRGKAPQTPTGNGIQPPVDDFDDQIRSDKFKAWFGDWQNDPEHASKVVDADGKPLVVEHSTPNEFTTFDIDKLGENSGDRGIFGAGFYFGDRGNTDIYGKNHMQVYLNMRKPFVMEDYMPDDISAFIIEHFNTPALRKIVLNENGKSITVGEYIDIVNAVNAEMEEGKHDAEIERISSFYRPDSARRKVRDDAIADKSFLIPGSLNYLISTMIGSQEFTNALRENGNDGVIVGKGNGYNEYVVFSPNQIKSATDNNGEFSRDNDDIRFSVSNPSTLSRSEIVTKALVQQANNNYNIMQSALKKVTADLKGIRAAMRMQSDYDRKVVDALLNLYNTLLQENGVWAQYMPDTTRRIATQIVHAIGKQNITEEVNTIMDHMVHAQAKAAQRQWDKLRQTPIDKINISGVVMQGKVALEGQHALKALNEVLDPENPISLQELVGNIETGEEGLIDKTMKMEDDAEDESQKIKYKGQRIGYEKAAQHLERLKHLQDERRQQELDLQAARANKHLSKQARQQLIARIQEMMRQNFIDQAEAYMQSTKDLQEYVTTQEGKAKGFLKRQEERKEQMRTMAAHDTNGIEKDPLKKKTKSGVIRWLVDWQFCTSRDLPSLLRMVGVNSYDGEGELFRHFMLGWHKADDEEFEGMEEAEKTLDEKAAELFKDEKIKTWHDLGEWCEKLSKKSNIVLNRVVADDTLYEEWPLTVDNALYIYAVSKMEDGITKLNAMNITDEDVANIAAQLDPRLIQLADWIQSEYFVQLRNRYNPTHEALYGAPMDAIEQYFPLRILKAALGKEVDVADDENDAAKLLPGTAVGPLKRRTKNTKPLDIANAGFITETYRHIQQMERWKAFAQLTRDCNILLSDPTFKGRINSMSTIYGEGADLYKYLKDAFKMAFGTYKPVESGKIMRGVQNVGKGVTGAKVAWRPFTALKQNASSLSVAEYLTNKEAWKAYAENGPWAPKNRWKENVEWALENLPNLRKRKKKGDLGDSRLMQRATDWEWNRKYLEFSTKYGMSFNRYNDVKTAALVARVAYAGKKADLLRDGYSEQEAHNEAVLWAEAAFNSSQQSSEGAYMAPVQQDRTYYFATHLLYRVSPMQYTRKTVMYARNIKNKMKKGAKERMINSEMQRYINLGWEESKAREQAEKNYKRSWIKDVVGLVVYSYGMNLMWRLWSAMPYLLYPGGDDDKKKDLLKRAVSWGFWASPLSGTISGGLLEYALDSKDMEELFNSEMPVEGDLARVFRALKNGDIADLVDKSISVLIQSNTGWDLNTTVETLTDAVYFAAQTEQDITIPQRIYLTTMAALSIPPSQREQMIIDRAVTHNDSNAEEDYIHYYKIHRAPITWWARGEEGNEEIEKAAHERFNKLLTERDKLHNPEDYEE